MAALRVREDKGLAELNQHNLSKLAEQDDSSSVDSEELDLEIDELDEDLASSKMSSLQPNLLREN